MISPIIQEISIQILIFLLLLIKRYNIFHSLPKLCKITPNFNPILSSEITVSANHKLFTLAPSGLKAIAVIQGNCAR